MSVEEQFSHFFKPGVRSEAAELLRKTFVFLQIGSDTQIDATVRGTTSSKVAFRSVSIESEAFSVRCSCKAFAKGQLCKHIWAVLLASAEKTPDFYASKNSIEKEDATTAAAKLPSPEAAAAADAFAEKQAAYRRQAYESQKQRAKNMKDERKARERGESIKGSAFSQNLPDEVKKALTYFEVNGFPMKVPVGEPEIGNAKRVLSRVFHPDKGGTNDEMLELLRHADVLLKFRI